MKRSSIIFRCIIFCLVVFNSSGNEFHSCTNICILSVVDPQNLLSYQVILQFLVPNSLLFCFKSRNEFILDICEGRQLKKMHLSHGKWNYFEKQFFFHPTCVQLLGCDWKIIVEMLVLQILKVRTADNKSLTMRSAAFEMQLSHGVWG